MQPQQQQQTVVTAAPVQPVYISQPYQTATVVDSFRHRQALIIAVLLIVVGSLSIIFDLIDIAVGEASSRSDALSQYAQSEIGHGILCGIMVSIRTAEFDYERKSKGIGLQKGLVFNGCRSQTRWVEYME